MVSPTLKVKLGSLPEIKDKLQLLIDDLIASLNVNELEDS